MSSYLAAATLNMAYLVVRTLDEQLKASDAVRSSSSELNKLVSQPVAAVAIIETDEGFGYGGLKIEIVLGIVDRVGKQTISVGNKFSELGMLELDEAYQIRFMPRINLG